MKKGIFLDYVNSHASEFVDEFKELVRIPSVSKSDEGVERAADWILERMQRLGGKVSKVTTPCHPIIMGRFGQGDRTLVVYAHYDTQPEGNRADWKTDPFSAAEISGRIYGRGTTDNKNGVMSSIHAVHALMETLGELPLSLVFVFEGEEEMGSPSFEGFLRKNRSTFTRCDAVLCCDAGGIDKQGNPHLSLGWKGDLHFTMKAVSQNPTLHSSLGVVTENPAWRLVRALSCLQNNGEIRVKGFRENIKTYPDLARTLTSFRASRKGLERQLGIRMKTGLSGSEIQNRLNFQPVININGIESGSLTTPVVPSSATAKVDIRIVPDQEPDEVFKKVVSYLHKHGFKDIRVEQLSGTSPAFTGPGEEIIAVSRESIREALGKDPILDICPAAAPVTFFPNMFGIPMSTCGSSAIWLAHGPNEYITKRNYLAGVLLYAVLFHKFARSDKHRKSRSDRRAYSKICAVCPSASRKDTSNA